MREMGRIKKLLKRVFGVLVCVAAVLLSFAGEVRGEDIYIRDDAFVYGDNSYKDKVMKETAAGKLIVGKGRHAYVRLDLSVLKLEETEEIKLGLTWEKGADNTLVVTECSEFLRDDSGGDSMDRWTEDNVTFSRRPLDVEGQTVRMKVTGKTVELDVMEMVSRAASEGKRELSLHITTEDVDAAGASGTDFYSSRAKSNGPYLSVVTTSGEGYLIHDAFVSGFSGQDNMVMISGKPEKLILGKKRHIYMRFNLSSFQADEVERFILYAQETHSDNTMVITQCSEYLQENGMDSSMRWLEDNVTYENRPLDLSDSKTVTLDFKKGASLKVDVTEILKDFLEKGERVGSLHITTAAVEDTGVNASEIYSTRSGNPPYLEAVLKNQEQPEEVGPEKTGENYYDTGLLPQKVFRIKGEDGKYLRLEDEKGRLVKSEGAGDASLFELYLFDYTEYEDEDYTKTSCAIRCLDNGKFLTIQNYFHGDEEEKKYFNEISQGFEIKAGADAVNWNERFYLKYYPVSKVYGVYSHLKTMRDDLAFAVTPVRAGEEMLFCATGNKKFYGFEFEEVVGQDSLEVLQEVRGDQITLSWYPVNGDEDLSRYEVMDGNGGLEMKGDRITTVLSGLEAGSHELRVVYDNGAGVRKEKTVLSRVFVHPGISHSQEDLEAMKEHIEKQEEPWYSDYRRLKTMVPDHMADSGFIPRPWEGVGRGTPAGHGNMIDFEQSGNAAYFNALQWVITGEREYAETAVRILNAWSDTLKIVDGRDRILGAAINSYRYMNAAEILKYYDGGYDGYGDEDFAKFQRMLENVIYPVIEDFGVPMLANGNWDTAAMISMASMGVVCENPGIYNRAIEGYQDIHINGSIAVYVSHWGQSVESARDQAHAQLGIGYMAEVCQVALNQGDASLYGLYDNRLARAFNWAARYNLYDEEEIPFEPLMNVFGDTKRGYWTSLDSEKINRGELRPVYELPLAYYSTVDGVDVTWMERAAEAMRPQGYVHNDNLNFGTMTAYSGEPLEQGEPYFQIRTRLEPWYQRTWSDVKKYGEPEEGIPETLNSYFMVNEDGRVTADARKAGAPYFQLVGNEDGTYGVRCAATDTYLSVKEEKEGEDNKILADAREVGENERFVLKGTGAGFYYLEAAAFDNRIVTVAVEQEGDPKASTLTMRLGTRITDQSAEIANEEKLIFVYNTGDMAGEGMEGQMVGISVDRLPAQTVYEVGEEFDPEGMVVVASYSNAAKRTLKKGEYEVRGFDSQEVGKQKLDVVARDEESGEEFSDSFYVEVVAEAFRTIRIEIKEKPCRLEYEVGDELDPRGIQVTKVKKASASSALRREPMADPESECDFDYDFQEEGKQSVTVIYREEDENGVLQEFTAAFSVTVKEEIFLPEYYTTKIKVEKKPVKLVYVVGEDLESSGMVVKEYLKASPSSASPKTRILDEEEYEAVYDFREPGKQRVKIVYYGINKKGGEARFTDLFQVTVKEREVGMDKGDGSDSGEDDYDYGVSMKERMGPVPERGDWVNGGLGWVFVKADGSLAKEEWVYITWKGENYWYYFDQDGFMASGWLKDRENWYFLKPDGSMASKEWVMSDGKWFYTTENGTIACDCWLNVNGMWYYFYSDGSMAAGERTPDGYEVNEVGEWVV